MHGAMRIGKRVNTRVMDYDLRDLDNEMNKRAWNLLEINELSGWKFSTT